ncbi:MFS transporter [Candidatus Magnetaquicoccus inordinatus]|uniref:MFS transporter n=1 Tax=Candidatus Magnetaquicoccus inordinatus TaxID=2496818 RepID=UPI00102AEDE8|nr:MFS transporter [Candidatus Magnetaquicoccus inordinatus]
MASIRQTVFILSTAQGLLSLNGVTLVAVSALAATLLTENRDLATLPVSGYAVGAALATLPASLIMQRWGRRSGFQLGALLGLCGGLLCAFALWYKQFWLLCCGCTFAGFYHAFGQQYRFAAADAADELWRSRAISYTLAGGILGGVLGPELSKWSWNLLRTPYTASYLSLALFALFSWLLMFRLRLPAVQLLQETGAVRSLWQIAAQPAYLVAVVAAVAGSGVMTHMR